MTSASIGSRWISGARPRPQAWAAGCERSAPGAVMRGWARRWRAPGSTRGDQRSGVVGVLLGLLGGFLLLRVEGGLFLGFLVALSDLVHGRAPDAGRRMSAPPHYRPLGSRKPARAKHCFAGVAPRSDATLRYHAPSVSPDRPFKLPTTRARALPRPRPAPARDGHAPGQAGIDGVPQLETRDARTRTGRARSSAAGCRPRACRRRIRRSA